MSTSARGPGARKGASPRRRRLALAAGAALVATVDLSAKAWAESVLRDRAVGFGPVDLRLAHNPGAAFSLGADAPARLVVNVTAVITAALGMFAWRAATGAPRGRLAGLALILGGATANVVDRARDGVVTDYLHTRWWPTFNLADAAIVTGAALLVLTTPRDGARSISGGDEAAA